MTYIPTYLDLDGRMVVYKAPGRLAAIYPVHQTGTTRGGFLFRRGEEFALTRSGSWGGTSVAMDDAYVLPKSSASPAMIMRQGCVPTRTACVNSLQGFAALDLPHDNSYPADAQAGPADADAVSPHHTVRIYIP